MLKLELITATSLVVMIISCGGSDSKSAVVDASLDTTSPTTAVIECKFPDCLANLAKDCTPSGGCTVQADGTNGMNLCYENGVKQIAVTKINPAPKPATASITMKKNDKVCYIIHLDVTNAELKKPMSNQVSNPEGDVIALIKIDTRVSKPTVSCLSQGAVFVNEQCLGADVLEMITKGMTGAPSACTPGTCSP
jgi:hypothetical protein